MKQQTKAINKNAIAMSVNTGSVEIRQDDNTAGAKKIIRGYAVVFDDVYTYTDWDCKQWTEKVDPHFFDDVDMSNVLLLRDHNYSRVLGRNGKNLRLEVDSKGLFYECELPNTALANETYELASQEICDQCSFGFSVKEEKTDYGNHISTLLRCDKLYEITITPIPAYQSTVVVTMSDNRNIIKEETDARQRAEAERKKNAEAEAKKLAEDESKRCIDELIDKINKL